MLTREARAGAAGNGQPAIELLPVFDAPVARALARWRQAMNDGGRNIHQFTRMREKGTTDGFADSDHAD